MNKLSSWLKRMILREQENVFLFEFELIVPAVLKCLFRHNFCRNVIPIYSVLLQSKIDDVYNVEQPGQT